MAWGNNSKANIDNLLEEEVVLRHAYYNACAFVRRCSSCRGGWTEWDNKYGIRQTTWDCEYCVPPLKEANRAWRAVRDKLRANNIFVDTLDDYQRRLED